jgi:serine protease Do
LNIFTKSVVRQTGIPQECVIRGAIFHAGAPLPTLRQAPSRSMGFPHRVLLLGIWSALLALVGCAQLQSTTVPPQASSSARQDVIDRIVARSVKVAIGQTAQRMTFASGVVIASRPARQDSEAVSYVLTAAHPFTEGNTLPIFVGFCGADAVRGKFAATLVSRDRPETLDLALLRVSGIAAPSIDISEDDSVKLGEQILVVGFPEGQRLGLSAGIVSQLPLSENQNGIPADRPEGRIVIDADAPRGVSGGGVFETQTGRLLGIVQGHHTFSIAVKDQSQSYALKFPVPGATFMIPLAQIHPFLRSPIVASELSGVRSITAHVGPAQP